MGIKATLSRLNAALKLHDRELWYHLDVKNQVEETTVLLRSSCGTRSNDSIDHSQWREWMSPPQPLQLGAL